MCVCVHVCVCMHITYKCLYWGGGGGGGGGVMSDDKFVYEVNFVCFDVSCV